MLRHALAIIGVVATATVGLIAIDRILLSNNENSNVSIREHAIDNKVESMSSNTVQTASHAILGNKSHGEIIDSQTAIPDEIYQGMFLSTIGSVKAIAQDTGGADPMETIIPPPEVIIIFHNSSGNESFIRLVNTGCVEPDIWPGDTVEVSGYVVKVVPNFAIILDCGHEAHVSRIKNIPQ